MIKCFKKENKSRSILKMMKWKNIIISVTILEDAHLQLWPRSHVWHALKATWTRHDVGLSLCAVE